MDEYLIQNTTLTALTDAFRSKTNTNKFLGLRQMTNMITAIEADGDAFRKYIGGEFSYISNELVTSVTSSRFYGNSTLTGVNFPACTIVNDRAFYNCYNLTDVNLSACKTIKSSAFYSCSNLKNINLPQCTFVDNYAFSYCSTLTDIDLPQCTSTGSAIFGACSSLKNISMPKCSSVGHGAFWNCCELESINLPSCKTLGSSAFYSCVNLKNISIPNCTSIGQGAFYKCSSLTNLNFISNFTSIGSSWFSGCNGLVNISHSKCKTIGTSAFYGCENLISANFPSVTTISGAAFYNCGNLTNISFPKCTTIYYNAFLLCTNLPSVDLPVCTSIAYAAFSNCQKLSYVNLPKLTSISYTVFYSCYSLSDVNIPLCRYISYRAFENCRSLSVVNFPSCYYIGSSAFRYCSNLSAVMLASTAVCTLSGTSHFYGTPIASGTGYVYVTPSLVASYKTATNWSSIANQILSLYDVTYPPTADSQVLPINYTTKISVPMLLKDKNSTPVLTANSSDESLVTISNLGMHEYCVEFDAITYDIENSADVTISATLNGNEFSKTINLVMQDMCDVSIKDTALIFNETRKLSASLYYMTHAPEVTISTSNDEAVTISNIVATSEDISFDVTAHTIEGNVEVTMTVVYNGRTYIKVFNVGVYKAENRPLPTYTVEDLTGTYGFKLDDDNYYSNTNTGAPVLFATCAVCNVNVESLWDCVIHIDYISYGPDKGYSFISNLDTELALSGNSDSESDIRISLKDYESGGIETVSYDMTSGKHFVCIKCYKPYGDKAGTTLKFAVRFEYVQ